MRAQLREEIDLYAQEIGERQFMLTEQRSEFLLMQFKLTKAERATRAAEVRMCAGAVVLLADWRAHHVKCSLALSGACSRQLSLLELEIDAKRAYLERLRLVLRS